MAASPRTMRFGSGRCGFAHIVPCRQGGERWPRDRDRQSAGYHAHRWQLTVEGINFRLFYSCEALRTCPTPSSRVGYSSRKPIARSRMFERTASAWLAEYGSEAYTYRFDAVAVTKAADGSAVIEVVEDAWSG